MSPFFSKYIMIGPSNAYTAFKDRLVKNRKKIVPNQLTYESDIIEGIEWSWIWSYSKILKLYPYCSSCQNLLFFLTGHTNNGLKKCAKAECYHCSEVYSVTGYDEWSLYEKVRNEILKRSRIK